MSDKINTIISIKKNYLKHSRYHDKKGTVDLEPSIPMVQVQGVEANVGI